VQSRARRMKDADLRRIYLASAPARDILAAAAPLAEAPQRR